MIKRSIIASAVKSALLASAAASMAFSSQAWAAEEDEAKEDESSSKITVTGSRIKRNQAVGAQPVITITNEDILNRGYTTVFEALNDLSQNTGVQIEGPEFSGGFTPNVQTLNLRGQGVGTSLTLINGRRLASYPAAYQSDGTVFNFGSIPAVAVDRIEILSTGASAIYGSDAIAGVVNIILRENVDDVIAKVLYGEQGAGKSTTRVQLLAGKTFTDGNFTVAFEHQDREGVYGEDYEGFDSELDFPYDGVPILARGIYNINNYVQYGDYSRSDDLYIPPPAGSCDALNNGFELTSRPATSLSATGDPRPYCGLDIAGSTSFRNPSTRNSIFVNANYNLDTDLELFTNILFSQNEGSSRRDYLNIAEDFVDVDDINSTFGLPQWSSVLRRFTTAELGQNLDTQFDEDSLSVIAGLRGFWGEHDWEVTVNSSTNTLEQSRPWWKAEEAIDIFLGSYTDLGGGLSFIDGWDGEAEWPLVDNLWQPLPDQFRDRLLGQQTYSNETSTSQLQFSMSGTLGEMDAGPIGYAMVLEYTDKDFELIPDDRLRQESPDPNVFGSGWLGLTGFKGIGDRQQAAIGGELSLPLSENVIVNLAGRIDSYDKDSSSIGTRFTPAANIEYRPTDSLLIRGGYSGSFRAPDMNLVFTESGFFTGATDLSGCFEQFAANEGIDISGSPSDLSQAELDALAGYQEECESQTIFAQRVGAQSLGAGEEPLKDETGYSMFVGFVVDITDNTSFDVTWSEQYLEDIARTESVQALLNTEVVCEYGDFIGLGGQQTAFQTGGDCANADNRITRNTFDFNGTPVTELGTFRITPVNAAENRIQSVDVNFSNLTETEFGEFRTRFEYTHVLKSVDKDNPEDNWDNNRDSLGFAGYNFRSRMSASLSFSRGDFTNTVTAIRRGSTPKWNQYNVDVSEGEDPRIGPHLTYNYSAVYDFTSDFRLALRVANLLDEKAPRDDTFEYYEYPWYNYFLYSGSGLGREWSLEASYRF